MNTDERDSVATQFGVSMMQIERDHFISHLLAFLSREFGNRIQFIGGTALARTHLPTGRLSENIDLIATQDRKVLAGSRSRTTPRTGTHSRPIGPLTSTEPHSGCNSRSAAHHEWDGSPAATAVSPRPGVVAD